MTTDTQQPISIKLPTPTPRPYSNVYDVLGDLRHGKGVLYDLTSRVVTPESLMALRQPLVHDWGSVPYMLVSQDIFNEMIASEEIIQALEPVAKHESLVMGYVADLFGMAVFTDAYVHPGLGIGLQRKQIAFLPTRT